MKVFLLVSALLLLSTLAVEGTAVYDISGEPLKRQTAYYITSAIWGAGGGGLYPHWCHLISLRSATKHPCEPYVAQSASDLNRGSPVTFSPVNAGSEVVHLLTDVSIQFQVPVPAHPDTKPTVWKLADADQQNEGRFVTLDSAAGNVESFFKIAKMNEFSYKLMYCPSMRDSSSIDAPCGDLGIHHENGKRMLGLSDIPFQVVFVKAGNV